jgi:hypothetical protein
MTEQWSLELLLQWKLLIVILLFRQMMNYELSDLLQGKRNRKVFCAVALLLERKEIFNAYVGEIDLIKGYSIFLFLASVVCIQVHHFPSVLHL